jgi:hypothetical protein
VVLYSELYVDPLSEEFKGTSTPESLRRYYDRLTTGGTRVRSSENKFGREQAATVLSVGTPHRADRTHLPTEHSFILIPVGLVHMSNLVTQTRLPLFQGDRLDAIRFFDPDTIILPVQYPERNKTQLMSH